MPSGLEYADLSYSRYLNQRRAECLTLCPFPTHCELVRGYGVQPPDERPRRVVHLGDVRGWSRLRAISILQTSRLARATSEAIHRIAERFSRLRQRHYPVVRCLRHSNLFSTPADLLPLRSS